MRTSDICEPFDLYKKLESFGWNTIAVNGHDFNQIRDALKQARACTDKPTAVIADTIKGKGIAQFEKEGSPHHLKLDDTTRAYLDEAVKKFEELIK